MKILVSAQDPGGTNSVLPVATELIRLGHEVVAEAEGVARDMFTTRSISLGTFSDPAVVLLGTSGGESVEKRVTRDMRSKAPTVAVLDFWSNYWQRFSSAGVKDFAYLPDLICVMDEIAKEEMIAEGFPPEKIVVTGNPHFDHFAETITRDTEDKKRILFISQPMRMDGDMPGFTPPDVDEYTILETLRDFLPIGHTLFIRLHPRDVADKYDVYLSDRVCLAPEATLEEALSASGLIIGVATPVLIQAVAAGKKALSYESVRVHRDDMVSNRTGVTTRIDSPEELARALNEYATGILSTPRRAMRDVWPAGATERVVEQVLSIASRAYSSL